jgi:peptidoglycan/xylan/chitin deacetylase (PgdA/CDA1 family)
MTVVLVGCSNGGGQHADTGADAASDGSLPDADGSTADAGVDSGFDSGLDGSIDIPDTHLGANLIRNPDVVNPSPDAGTNPEYWNPDSWGDLTAKFSWVRGNPNPPYNDIRTEVTGYGEEGDAKWIFDSVPVDSGSWYEYSDLQKSDGRTRLITACEDPDGIIRYQGAWQTDKALDWSPSTFRFYVPAYPECLMTVLHILDRDGWLETAGHSMYKVTQLPLRTAIVSVTFDDIMKTAVTVGAAELEKGGFKGTFYVTKDFAQDTSGKYGSETDVINLIKSGHEIGSHSASHAKLTRLTPDMLMSELDVSAAYLRGLGAEVNGIAYPSGDFNDKVEKAAKLVYGYARTSLEGLNDQTVYTYRVRILPVTTETTDQQLLSAINSAYVTSTWLVLLFHGLGVPDPLDPYITPVEQYKKVIERLGKGDVAVKTVTEALKFIGRL